MSLYQKPGALSSEFAIVKAYAMGGLGMIISGAVAAAPEWSGRVPGLFLIGCGTLVGIVPAVAYALSRGRVKAAAEANKPPQSRVF